MNAKHAYSELITGVGILCLTLLSHFVLPGHTYLAGDTQLYVAALEHLDDRSVLAKDFAAVHPWFSLTIYDEITLGLRRLSSMDLHSVVVAQQLGYRALGIVGILMMARSLQLSCGISLLLAGVYSMGGSALGPGVAVLETEPVPRGFSTSLVVLALGLLALGRVGLAGITGAVALLYHPPMALTFWLAYIGRVVWSGKSPQLRRYASGLIPFAAALGILAIAAKLQPGVTEPQPFFATVDATAAALQRMRAPYVWVSHWAGKYGLYYFGLWAASIVALRRIGPSAGQDLAFFGSAMPLLGIFSMPASYVLYEKLGWSLIPALQPARSLVFVLVIAPVLALAAGVYAAQRHRRLEAFLWFIPVFAPPAAALVVEVALFNLRSPNTITGAVRAGLCAVLAVAMVLGLALLASAVSRLDAFRPGLALAGCVLTVGMSFSLVKNYGRLQTYPVGQTPELNDLCAWAQGSTAKDAVFLFPDAGKSSVPGVFRAKALRAVYVDWKSGGAVVQFPVNYPGSFSHEWWRRWQLAMGERASHATYRRLGIEYIVLQYAPEGAPPPLYQNPLYFVYSVAPPVGAATLH